jgi:dTDP-4-amino-4,6-dideoxygalactose transaminase
MPLQKNFPSASLLSSVSTRHSAPNRELLQIASPETDCGEEFLDEVRRILASRQLTNGTRVRQLEQTAATYLGVPHCVAVSSCTAGLLLTLRVLALTGEVILPSFTFHATAHTLLWNGLKPVFVDCDERTFCIDAADVRKKVCPATAAILGVHLFGCPAPVDELEEISTQYCIPLIYDAAHAFGSTSGTRHIGIFGNAEIFSFSPTKLIVAGEGGLIATRDAALARKLRAARNYGDAGDGNPQILGLNARMSELHAALALTGFATLEWRLRRRNEIRLHYIRRLEHLPGVSFQRLPDHCKSTCKDMPVLIDESMFGASRDVLLTFLRDQSIEARRYFWPPVHRQALYANIWDRRPLPVTDRVANRILSLPIYSSLTDLEVDRICDAIHRAFELAQYCPSTPQVISRQACIPRSFTPTIAAERGKF